MTRSRLRRVAAAAASDVDGHRHRSASAMKIERKTFSDSSDILAQPECLRFCIYAKINVRDEYGT